VVRVLERIALAERGRQRDWPLEYGQYLNVLGLLAPLKAMRAGPLYRLSEPPAGAASAMRIIGSNADLLRGGLDEWLPDVAEGRPMYATVVDGHAVSVCASVHVFEGAHVTGVETLPPYRRRGLAAQAVASWAHAVSRLNAAPLYGTSFDNLASQGVARRLGMKLLGVEFSIECAFPEGS
jgi:GNAT superfamily N-acetyltransferase